MDYYKIIHPATGKVVNLYSTDSSSAVANGTRLLLYTWLDNNDQKWGLDYVGDLVLMRLARDNSKVMNRHSGNNNAIVWYYDGTAETQKDSLINTETENGNMRIKLAKRGLYLTKNADDNYLYWTSKINSNRQYFKLEKVSGSSTKGEIDLPTNRTYNWSQFTPEVMSICDRYGCSLTCLILPIFLALTSIPPMKFIRSASGPTMAYFIGKFLPVVQVKSKRMATILVVRAMCLPLQKHRFRQTILLSSS